MGNCLTKNPEKQFNKLNHQVNFSTLNGLFGYYYFRVFYIAVYLFLHLQPPNISKALGEQICNV